MELNGSRSTTPGWLFDLSPPAENFKRVDPVAVLQRRLAVGHPAVDRHYPHLIGPITEYDLQELSHHHSGRYPVDKRLSKREVVGPGGQNIRTKGDGDGIIHK